MKQKPVIMITFRENSEGSGPYQSHLRIVNSKLKEKYDFKPLIMPEGHLGVFNLKVIRNLVNQIKSQKPDIVHYTGLELVGWYGMLACKFSKHKKTLMAIRGSSSEAIEFNKNIIKKYIMKIIEMLTLISTKYCYGVSEYVSSWNVIRRYGRNYLGKIYNLPGEAQYNHKIFRKEFNLKINDIIIVSTGRIEKEKGFEILKKIICENTWEKNVKFVIVGDGLYLNTMKKEIYNSDSKDNVIFTGYRSDIYNILSGSDIFVMCSLHETLCNSAIEACRMGLPLVVSNVGGLPEIVSNGKNGFLVENNDCIKYTEYIKLLIKDINLREQMGINSLDLFNGLFNEKYILSQIDSVYETVLKGV